MFDPLLTTATISPRYCLTPLALPPAPPLPRVESVWSRARLLTSYTLIWFVAGSLVMVTANVTALWSALRLAIPTANTNIAALLIRTNLLISPLLR